jgi:glycosyltransferase 2 family protein
LGRVTDAGRRIGRVPLVAAVGRRIGLVFSVLALSGFVLWALRQDAPRFPTEAGDLAIVVLAIAVYAAAALVRGWRWHVILKHNDVAHRRRDAYALSVVGYAGNNVLPARGGEVLRIVLLSMRSTARKRDVLGSVIAERVLDTVALAGLFVVLSAAKVADASAGDAQSLVAVGLLVAGACAVAVYLALRRRGRFQRFADTVRPLVRMSRRLMSPAGLGLLAATTAVWSLEGAIFWLVGQSLGLELTLIEGLFLMVLSGMFALVPAAPGYVGTFDAGVLVGLGRVGIHGGSAVTFALLVRFVLYVPITVVGLLLLVTRYGGLKLLRQERRTAASRS